MRLSAMLLAFFQCRLHLLPEFHRNDGLMLAFVGFILMDDAADIERVVENLIERLIAEGLAALLHQEFTNAADGNVIELKNNYRSTPRIINVANAWSQTIQQLGSLPNPHMAHGNTGRTDYSERHVSISRFADTVAEADRIAATINALVNAAAKLSGYIAANLRIGRHLLCKLIKFCRDSLTRFSKLTQNL